jgi:hypothetical protein
MGISKHVSLGKEDMPICCMYCAVLSWCINHTDSMNCVPCVLLVHIAIWCASTAIALPGV